MDPKKSSFGFASFLMSTGGDDFILGQDDTGDSGDTKAHTTDLESVQAAEPLFAVQRREIEESLRRELDLLNQKLGSYYR